MFSLRRNMYNLDFAFKPKDMTPPYPDLLTPVRCSCVFWADHLCVPESWHCGFWVDTLSPLASRGRHGYGSAAVTSGGAHATARKTTRHLTSRSGDAHHQVPADGKTRAGGISPSAYPGVGRVICFETSTGYVCGVWMGLC